MAVIAWLGPVGSAGVHNVHGATFQNSPSLRLVASSAPGLQTPPRPQSSDSAGLQRLVALGVAAWVGNQHLTRRHTQKRKALGRLSVACAAAKETVPVEQHFVDEEAMLAKSTFAIKPDDLIRRCKEVLAAGVGTKDEGADFADDFEFCAPVVGPIDKEEYLSALGTFKIQDAFPDSNPNYHHFRVDPFEPDTVWFQTRKIGTNTGEFMKKPATGIAVTFPPEAYSLKFNEAGKVREFTVGYVVNKRVGNTGGLGGAFGYFCWQTIAYS